MGVTLAIYGDDLDPDAVSARLGCAPTSSFRKGDRRAPHRELPNPRPPAMFGAWFLEARGEPPFLADDLVATVLGRLPADEAFWAALRRDYKVELRCGVHWWGWHRGFELSPATVRLIAAIGAPLMYDIYAYQDDDE